MTFGSLFVVDRRSQIILREKLYFLRYQAIVKHTCVQQIKLTLTHQYNHVWQIHKASIYHIRPGAKQSLGPTCTCMQTRFMKKFV